MAKVQLSGDIEARLAALSKARNTTPHYLMKTAIERFLDIEEALEAERQLVLARWEKFEITGETRDHDVVKSWVACLQQAGSFKELAKGRKLSRLPKRQTTEPAGKAPDAET